MQYINTPAGRIAIQEPSLPTSFMKYSRLYGFRGTEPVPEEQYVIQYVVETIANSLEPVEETVTKLVEDLNNKGVRRSEKRWIRSTVLGIVRPVFSGRISVDGGYAISEHYKPIVPWTLMQKAMEKLK